jgi:translation initiation factor 3 subunit B
LQEAQTAREQTNGYKLDRSHVFVVNMFDDFDKYMKVPDEWVPPESKPYTPGVIFFILCYYWPYML